METKKDGKYFLELHNKEKSRILKLADDAEKELENVQIDVSFMTNFDVKKLNLLLKFLRKLIQSHLKTLLD